jgi:hypothetical protein
MECQTNRAYSIFRIVLAYPPQPKTKTAQKRERMKKVEDKKHK